jgi:hypothetical protein
MGLTCRRNYHHITPGSACMVALRPQLLGDFSWRLAARHRVWAVLVVIGSPLLDHNPSMTQGMVPVLVQAFVPELPVEALDECILCGLAGLDRFQLYARLVLP